MSGDQWSVEEMGLSFLDDPTLQPVFRGELSDFTEEVEKLHAQAAFYCEMHERHESDPTLPLCDFTAHRMPTPRRYLRLFIEKFERVQTVLDSCRDGWEGIAFYAMHRRQDESTEAYNYRLWLSRRDSANTLLEKLRKIEASCDRASLSIASPEAAVRKGKSDAPNALLKAKCFSLKTAKSQRTWADVRLLIHRDHSHLLLESRRNALNYPSDETMQRWQRQSKSKPR